MWRDEIQAWSLALNSHSFSELFFNTRYEGHPKLWFVILFLLQKLTGNIFYMQLIHLITASLTVFVFSFFSPFNFLKNFLFCFGYFFAYEYAVISRDYAIELLLLFLSAGIYLKTREKSIIIISILVFLLLQTNVYAVILGMAFYGYIILSLKKPELLTLKTLLANIIVLSGVILFFISTVPPPDGGFSSEWNKSLNVPLLLQAGSTIFRSYFPFPQWTPRFWNTNFTDSIPGADILQFFLSILIVIFSSLLFYKKKNILLLFYTGTFGILFFSYAKYLGYMRHHGHFFILFILCCWLYFFSNNNLNGSKTPAVSIAGKYFLTLILLVQVCASFAAAFYEIKYPFSNAYAVKNYLKSGIPDKMIIIGDVDAPVSSISGLMNKKFYFRQGPRWSTYVTWDTLRKGMTDTAFFSETKKVSNHFKANVLLILSYNPAIKPADWYFLKSFNDAIVNDENYFIYLVKYFEPIKE